MGILTRKEYDSLNKQELFSGKVLSTYNEEQAKKKAESLSSQYKSSIKEYQNILKTAGVNNTPRDFRTNAGNKIITKEEYLPTASEKNRLEENRNKLIPLQDQLKEAQEKSNNLLNQTRLANYEYDVAKENNRDVTWLDKTVGVPYRAVKDLLSNFSLTNNPSAKLYKDESGNKTVLPTANELRQQNVSNSYETKAGKLISDIVYSGTKILGSSFMGAPGKALYWSDMFTDNFVNTVNQGYDDDSSLLYATLSTASELVTEKLMGGLSKLVPGGSSGLSQTINKTLGKVMKNDRLRSVLSNALSEGSEEFVQEYVDLVNRNLVLGEDNKFDLATFENALYSGLVGMGTGGLSGGFNVDVNTNNTGIINKVDNNGNFETNTNQINRINNVLNNSEMSSNIIKENENIILKDDNLTVNEVNSNIIPYTSREKNNFMMSTKIKIASSLKDIKNFVAESKKVKSSNMKLYLGKVSDVIANRINQETGINIENFNISLKTDAIKHILSNHSNSKENLRGQMPIVESDFNLIPEIISNYDDVKLSETTENGNPVLVFEKEIDGIYYLVSYVSNRQHNLEVKTMYKHKKKNSSTADNIQKDLFHTSKTDSGTSSYIDNDIIKTQNSQIVPLSSNNNMQNNQNNELKENNVLKVNKNNNTDKGKRKTRKWSETVQKSKSLDKKVLEEAMKNQDYTYIPDSNRKQVDRANNIIATLGYEGAINKLNSKFESGEVLNANDLALSQVLLQKASNLKDVDNVQNLLEINCIAGTEVGQAVQSLSIIKKLSSEGQLRVLKRTVDYMKKTGQKGADNVKITDDMVKTILDSKNSDELVKNMDAVKQQIAEQMTSNFEDKVIAWRYLSMLGNPRTHIRNIVSNTAMKGTMGIKNTIARTLETMLDKVIKNNKIERTKTFKKATGEVKKFVDDYTINSADILKNTSKYSIELELKKAKKIFGNKGVGAFVQKLYDFNSNALELEDTFFKNSTFKSAMSEYLTANGIETQSDIDANPNLVNNAVLYATEESLKSTFQQYNALASSLNQLKKKNRVTQFALDAVMPFTKTPANILNTGASYSPLGLLKTITYDTARLRSGKINLTQYIDNISQGLTGTGIVMLGYTLAQTGLLRTGSGDDKEDKYDEALGKQEYSIEIAGKSFTLDWLSPVAMPLFVGAELSNMQENGIEDSFNMNTVTNMLTTTFDPMMNMSLLQGLNNALSGYSENKLKAFMEESIKSYIGQFVPTISGQIAKTIDPTIRSTSASKDSGWTLGEQILRTNMAKIPGLTYFLEPSLDVWGNERQRSDNIIIRAFENFIAPYTRKNDITSSVDKKLKEIYAETGEDSVIPTINLSKTITFKGEKYQTNASDYTEFKKTYGTESFKYLNKLFETKTYKNASNEEKVRMIKNVYEYAKDTAKKEYLEQQGVEYTNSSKNNVDIYKENSIIEAIKEDISIDAVNYKNQNPDKYNVMIKSKIVYDDYSNYRETVNDIKDKYEKMVSECNYTGDKLKKYKEYISKSKKEEIFKYINNLNYNKNQKIILFNMLGGYSIKDYQSSIFNYINNLDISKKEKEEMWKYLYGN